MSSRWEKQPGSALVAWRKQRLRILARDGGACQMGLPGCTQRATQVDHLLPWVPGQVVLDVHLQAACAHCNGMAGSPETRARNPEVPRPSWL